MRFLNENQNLQWNIQMKYNILGASGTAISPICLGTMMFGGPTPDKEALRIIDHALDNGVNFINTNQSTSEATKI